MTYTIEQIRRATDSECICDRTDYERMRKLKRRYSHQKGEVSRLQSGVTPQSELTNMSDDNNHKVFHSCAIQEPARSNYFEDRRCD